MKKLNFTLCALIVAGLNGCGNNNNTGQSGLEHLPVQFDASSDEDGLGDSTSGVDLVLSDVSFVDGVQSEAGKTIAIEARLQNNGDNSYDFSNVSMSLEYSTTQSFDRVYRSVVFDIRQIGGNGDSVNVSARTNAASLPSGSYFTRLAVNPDWRLYFDNLPVDSDYSRTSRYLPESDYGNNVSETFQFDVMSEVSCIEDGLEPNNEFGSATVLLPNGVVNGSLCEDDVDLYSIQINGGDIVAAKLDYLTSNQLGKTRYLVLDPQHKRVGDSAVAISGEQIRIAAPVTGEYYLALYGDRSEYSLSLIDGASLFDDPMRPFFTSESMQGPYSPIYGEITLKKLAFDKEMLIGEIASCGIQTASYQNEQAVAYATPQHFSADHVFRFVDNDSYLVDGTLYSGWATDDGDISHMFWYENLFPGWAEDIGDGGWRYWAPDGLSYVECNLN